MSELPLSAVSAVSSILGVSSNPQVAHLICDLAKLPQVNMPLIHRFQEGVYLREIFMPADTYVIGHVHKHRHWNIILSGSAMVAMEGVSREVKAGDVIESGPGVQKLLYILDDMRWITVHANSVNLADISKLEETIIEVSPEFLEKKGKLTIDEFRRQIPKLLNPDL